MCKVAPLAGETKVWQYITLMRRIYLIDCPGVVYSGKETDEEKVLKGVVRVEMVEQPHDYVPTVLERVKPDYLARTYRIEVCFIFCQNSMLSFLLVPAYLYKNNNSVELFDKRKK